MGTCETCRFWHRFLALGECRFNPPTVIAVEDGISSFWPDTQPDWGCGKHEPIESPQGDKHEDA